MKKTQARVLIQGHNSDDVAETFLWRISEVLGWKDYAVQDQYKNTKTII